MLVEGYSFKDAYELVKKARGIAKPNDGFIDQVSSIFLRLIILLSSLRALTRSFAR
jgi:hypothetical protein